jgi:hypothetical protein
MAATSKYIRLNDQMLLEYIYQDPSSPDVIDTDLNGARVLVLANSYTGTRFLFTEDNPYVTTGNYRTRSSIPVNAERTRYAYLTTNQPLNYLDYDSNLPSVNTLLSQLTSIPNIPSEAVQYDTLRIHMISGFSFQDLGDGFIFEILVTDSNGKKHNLTSLTYLNSDIYEQPNPDEFIIGERLYTKYIELKIPATGYLLSSFNPGDNTSVSHFLTAGIGIMQASMIDINLKSIALTQTINGYKYFLTGEQVTTSISMTDEYLNLAAVIQESDAGDYFELYGEYNGIIYENFIFQLNSLPNTEILVFHDIVVSEQVGSNTFITSQNTFMQTGNFEEPYRFRPIIINSANAVSYSIQYTLRIFNKYDNSQIIRDAQYSSFDVKKYGRRMRKINLGVEPVVAKVYNILPDNKPVINLNSYNRMNLVQNSAETNPVIQTQFITSLADRNRISASVSSVKIVPAVPQQGDVLPTASGQSTETANNPIRLEQISSTDRVYQQGEAPISITPFDNFYMFIIYNNARSSATGLGEPQLVDLTLVGNLYINFYDRNTGVRIRLRSYNNIQDVNPTSGEVVFKIASDDSNRILGMTDRTYYITSVLETGGGTSEETLLYAGTWYQTRERYDRVASETITELQTSYTDLFNSTTETINANNLEIQSLRSQNSYNQQYIQSLENTVAELGGNIANLQSALAQSQDAIAQSQLAFQQATEQTTTASRVSQSQSNETASSQSLYEKQKGTNTSKIKINK